MDFFEVTWPPPVALAVVVVPLCMWKEAWAAEEDCIAPRLPSVGGPEASEPSLTTLMASSMCSEESESGEMTPCAAAPWSCAGLSMGGGRAEMEMDVGISTPPCGCGFASPGLMGDSGVIVCAGGGT